jgi:hypothetical protein
MKSLWLEVGGKNMVFNYFPNFFSKSMCKLCVNSARKYSIVMRITLTQWQLFWTRHFRINNTKCMAYNTHSLKSTFLFHSHYLAYEPWCWSKCTVHKILNSKVTTIYHKACADSALNKCLYHNPCRCERLPSSILSPHCEHCRGHRTVPIQHLETDLLSLFLGHSRSFLGYLSGKEINIIKSK